jgi:hypothetical protein
VRLHIKAGLCSEPRDRPRRGGFLCEFVLSFTSSRTIIHFLCLFLVRVCACVALRYLAPFCFTSFYRFDGNHRYTHTHTYKSAYCCFHDSTIFAVVLLIAALSSHGHILSDLARIQRPAINVTAREHHTAQSPYHAGPTELEALFVVVFCCCCSPCGPLCTRFPTPFPSPPLRQR